MAPVIRAAALRGLAPLVDELGGDGAELLARFGVARDAPDDDHELVPAAAVAGVLEVAAAELARPDLGLRLAERQDTGILGPLAIALESSPTLGDALDSASRFLFVHSPVLSVERGPDPEGARGVVGLYYRSTAAERPTPQAVDLGLGVFHRVTLRLAGDRYGLRSAHLPHPPLAPVATYTDFFGADVRFDRADAVLRVPAHLVDTPVAGGDETLRVLAMDYLATRYPDPGESAAVRVHRVLAGSLESTSSRIDQVARVLRVHPRTLQRRLGDEGTTYEQVLDDVRREAVHRLLTRTRLPLSQVAALVGFSEQSALTRAVRRWTGRTPTQVRREAVTAG